MSNKETTLYQQTRLNKTQQWKIWVVEKGSSGFPEVHTQFGYTDGKQQTTFEVIKEGVNIGKANEVSAVNQSYLIMERKITKQKEEGYTENLKEAQDKKVEIDWAKPFPKELCFYKPKTSIEEKKLEKLEKAKKAIYSVKRDGQMVVIRMSDFGLEIYSRRMDNITAKFPHLTPAFNKLPKQTILLGEMILEKNGKDSIKLCSSILRSDPEVAIEKQKEMGNTKYYAFDLAFHEGKNLLATTTFQERHKLLTKIITKLNDPNIVASELINKTHQEALDETDERGLEGLVIWDADGIMEEDEAITISGKPYRPNVLWKSKKKMETDMIVRWNPKESIGDYGKGKLKDLIGNAFMYQLHEGKEVYLGKVGGGLSEEQRKYYTKMGKFVLCWKIEFDYPHPKTGSPRFPVMVEDRTLNGDKSWEECEIDPRILEAIESGEDE